MRALELVSLFVSHEFRGVFDVPEPKNRECSRIDLVSLTKNRNKSECCKCSNLFACAMHSCCCCCCSNKTSTRFARTRSASAPSCSCFKLSKQISHPVPGFSSKPSYLKGNRQQICVCFCSTWFVCLTNERKTIVRNGIFQLPANSSRMACSDSGWQFARGNAARFTRSPRFCEFFLYSPFSIHLNIWNVICFHLSLRPFFIPTHSIISL